MSKKIIYGLLGIVVVLVIVIVGFKTDWYGLKDKTNGTNSTTSGYSAVFLSNGQVYFGKLSNVESDWIDLTDIYYLQVAQQKELQPKDDSATTADGSKLSLVKLGNELHGPKDQMIINQKHVLFWEELKSDGKVVQSIEKYLQDQAKK